MDCQENKGNEEVREKFKLRELGPALEDEYLVFFFGGRRYKLLLDADD